MKNRNKGRKRDAFFHLKREYLTISKVTRRKKFTIADGSLKKSVFSILTDPNLT
jgi:hypothetical protein